MMGEGAVAEPTYTSLGSDWEAFIHPPSQSTRQGHGSNRPVGSVRRPLICRRRSGTPIGRHASDMRVSLDAAGLRWLAGGTCRG